MLIELFAVHTRIELVSPERQSGRIAITPMNQFCTSTRIRTQTERLEIFSAIPYTIDVHSTLIRT